MDQQERPPNIRLQRKVSKLLNDLDKVERTIKRRSTLPKLTLFQSKVYKKFVNMKSFVLLSVLLVSIIYFAIDVSCDEATDLKVQNQKFTEAKKVLAEVIARMKSDYIKNFASILAKGVTDLEERTQNELKTEKDANKRKEIIQFATKAYERLVKFIKEIEEHFPTTA